MMNNTKLIIGCGFHPAHFIPSDAPAFISLPPAVKFIELGLSEFDKNSETLIYPGCDLSLHLARSPITESEKTQNTFIIFLKEKILKNKNKLSSIGIHLTGARTEGIGKLGFSSHFSSTAANEENAIRFINNLQNELNLPVWIENANFYSSSAQEVIKNWESTKKILAKTNCRMIFDLTHCFIESRNLGLNPEFIFGLVPWHRVSEIHVSGYVTGSDGALHDGHSQPVKPEIWNLLNLILEKFISSHEIIVNIEHTDLSWTNCKDDYLKDFSILNQLQPHQKKSNFNEKQIDYAISNLNRILSLRHPEIQGILSKNGLEQKVVLRTWINEFMQSDLRLVFSKNEIPECEFEDTVGFVDGFLEYLRKN